MRVTAVGTSGGVPTPQYGTSCLHLNAFGDEILLDCGEGSAQRLMRYDTSPDVDAVVLTHFHADHTLGIPGLLQALEMNERERPLDIHVPEGRTERARSLIEGAYDWPSYTVTVCGYDDDDPMRQTDRYSVQAFETPYTECSHGICVREADKRTFLIERARDLGVDPGPKYGKLQDGQPIETDDGTVVEPDDVLSDPEAGRTIVYTGDTRPTPGVVDAASNSTLLIYNAMFADDRSERARETGHSTAREAGQVASESESERLWLTHISPRHEGEEDRLEAEASESFDRAVTAVRDGDSIAL